MNTEQLEKELIPVNENLVKIKSPRAKVKRAPRQGSMEGTFAPEEMDFKQCDPFKNSLEFLKYYRSFLRVYNSNTRFYPFHTELAYAAEILDMLTTHGRNNDLRFLKSWMRFYYVNFLKDNNPYREDKTSLREFKPTFSVYNPKYIG